MRDKKFDERASARLLAALAKSATCEELQLDYGSTHVFSEIFIHLNWHCLGNKSMITPQMEPALFRFITEHCRKVKGVHFLALNGTPTHVHLAIQVEPFVSISSFVGKIKGASAYDINKAMGRKVLQWQRGYGAVSFSKRQTQSIVEYIAKQKEHHGVAGASSLIPALENYGEHDDNYILGGVNERLENAEAVAKPR